MPRSMGNCDIHPAYPVEYYCEETAQFLCAECLRVADSHIPRRLIPVKEAYQRQRNAGLPEVESLTADRREVIRRELAQIDRVISQVQDEGKQAEDHVFALVQECLDKFQQYTEDHVQTLLSDNLNTKRQLEYLEWIDGFIAEQMTQLSPPMFLRAWTRHCALRKQLGEMWGVNKTNDIKKHTTTGVRQLPGTTKDEDDEEEDADIFHDRRIHANTLAAEAIKLVGGIRVSTTSLN
ncbi:unnamed protein product [Amoebophrya sp. A25]|nr:unnamed protein product [Amoebophrya sp. A25]|eukprot:GSA25T00004209001.1